VRRWLLALGFLWSTCAAAQEPTVSILAGGLVSMDSEAGTTPAPLVRIAVSVPVTDLQEHGPRLAVQADLGALPGATIDLAQAETFRSLEFRMALIQPISVRVYADLYAEAGFATLLPGETIPRDKTLRFASGGVRFGRFGRGWLQLGMGGDQRLDGLWRTAVTVAGGLKLYRVDSGPLKGASMQLLGEAVLGLQVYGQGARRDVVRVGVAVGR